jgi:hypothetical protein
LKIDPPWLGWGWRCSSGTGEIKITLPEIVHVRSDVVAPALAATAT